MPLCSIRNCLLAVAVACSTPAFCSDEGAAPDPQAVEVLERDALTTTEPSSRDVATVAAFKRYLGRVDTFADYLTREESASFQQAQRDDYVGIGLELERSASGRIVAYPLEGSPAARAGIVAGDDVVALEGHSTFQLALPSLVAMAAGPAGSTLVLDISRAGRAVKRVSMVRTQTFGAVVDAHQGPYSIVQIRAFTAGTRADLEFSTRRLNSPNPIVIDLRGNRGGDVHAAIDCAMLFLRRGDTIATIRSRQGSRAYRSSIEGRSPDAPIYLWQDEGTASAAEAFVAALTENHRAISIGRRSFGKGTEQRMIPLNSGAMLILTTGTLLTPAGNQIDGHGLQPNDVVPRSAPTSKYVDEVTRLTHMRQSAERLAAERAVRVAG